MTTQLIITCSFIHERNYQKERGPPMAVSNKELAKKKATAKLILEAKGLDFDEWLAQKYDEVFSENEEIIQKALKSFKDQTRKLPSQH
ncbi:hypothetical protein [Enterococcus avium]|uniref:hypothetical protein n=2 Tax=Enterococcus TaxID=1350 RepID=UPI000B681F90|nr:hypothetical protein A5865_001300 [Enterococcus sp. 12E11_DIV0728]OUZ16400.1 hypothetical protein A5868_001321 [Enterococcus sp. 12F9_DIV0723]